MNRAGELALILLCGSAALAQQRTISARAGTINYQRGAVYLDNQRVRTVYGATRPVQLKTGQRLRVETGKVELLLGLGVYLRMLGPSSIRMDETHLADTRVVVEEGSAIIEVAGMNKGAQLHVICGEGSTELKRDGFYRFDAPMEAAGGRLRVYSGEATVENTSVERNGAAPVKGRSGISVALGGNLELSKFDPKDGGALLAWAAERSQRRIETERRRLAARAMQAARRKAEMDIQ